MPDVGRFTPASMESLSGSALDVAPMLLNASLVSNIDGHVVAVRITEVEAYLGVAQDPSSHAFRGPTKRNSSMFLRGGHAYVYRSYGMHWCVNVVVGPEGEAGAVLVRAGEVTEGYEAALARRRVTGTVRRPEDLASGPGRLCAALGITGDNDGQDFGADPALSLWQPREPSGSTAAVVGTSTRTGVSGAGGVLPYRFFLRGERTVSRHRPAPDEKTTK
jgi:DNA-3-methyladenine glycosylase